MLFCFQWISSVHEISISNYRYRCIMSTLCAQYCRCVRFLTFWWMWYDIKIVISQKVDGNIFSFFCAIVTNTILYILTQKNRVLTETFFLITVFATMFTFFVTFFLARKYSIHMNKNIIFNLLMHAKWNYWFLHMYISM